MRKEPSYTQIAMQFAVLVAAGLAAIIIVFTIICKLG
jgi:hypothetical protein